jgi:hypothetical protein
MDLEAVNLRQVIKPMIDRECGVSVGLNLSGAQAGAKEDTSSICWNCANNLKFCWRPLFVSDVEL